MLCPLQGCSGALHVLTCPGVHSTGAGPPPQAFLLSATGRALPAPAGESRTPWGRARHIPTGAESRRRRAAPGRDRYRPRPRTRTAPAPAGRPNAVPSSPPSPSAQGSPRGSFSAAPRRSRPSRHAIDSGLGFLPICSLSSVRGRCAVCRPVKERSPRAAAPSGAEPPVPAPTEHDVAAAPFVRHVPDDRHVVLIAVVRRLRAHGPLRQLTRVRHEAAPSTGHLRGVQPHARATCLVAHSFSPPTYRRVIWSRWATTPCRVSRASAALCRATSRLRQS